MTSSTQALRSQPRALFLLAFTQLWESFSYYGMRALLVLFLIGQLKVAEGDAYAIYGLYTCLVELGAFLGGYCADRLTGLRTAVVLGGGCIAVGHLLLTYADAEPVFFLGLGGIICGSMLFRGNLKALVGSLYQEGDRRREGGFALFYVGINLGGFAATLLCGYAAQAYGWHIGFGLAALGMLLGMVVFLSQIQTNLITDLKAPFSVVLLLAAGAVGCGFLLTYANLAQVLLFPIALISMTLLLRTLWKMVSREQALTLIGLLSLLIVYFTFEELMGSLLIVFSENQIDRMVLGWEIPSTVLSATNPLVIICCGPLLSFFLQNRGIGLTLRLGIAFLLLGAAFALLYGAAVSHAATAVQMILSFAAIAAGELFLAPAVYAYCSEVSPQRRRGFMMGVVTLAFALASLLSGQVGQLAAWGGEGGIPLLFLGASGIALSLSAGLLILHSKRKGGIATLQ